jgi:D-3-phosphoglycerate dehydrogenase
MAETSFSKDKMKVVLFEGVHASAVDAFRSDGYSNIEIHQKALPEPQLIDAVRDAYIVGIRSATPLTLNVLESARHLIGVGCFCIGTNQVDLATAQDRGVPVFNAPFSNTRSVAELVLAEIVLLMRGIPARNAAAHRGEWIKSAAGSREARGKTLGIIGYGHIGTQVGVLAESLGMQVVFYDIEMKLALGNARPMPTMQALLEIADVVTLHVPETPQTTNLIGASALARMKPAASLINASRGHVVDIDALVQALHSGRLSGAAIDVFPREPKSNTDTFISPLRGRDNVILTPHIGGSTQEAQHDIGLEVSSKLLKYSNNGSTLGAVNFPEVSLPAYPGQHRLLHIHRNQPGVLSEVNSVLSEKRINITGQFLQTNSKIGYVVIDIEAPERAVSMALRKRLDQVAGTIRTRILY